MAFMKPCVSSVASVRNTALIGSFATRTGIPSRLRVALTQSHVRELRVGEHAVGHEPIAGAARSSGQVFANDMEVVAGHMRELWAAGAISHRPDVGRSGLQSVVDANISARIQRNAGLLQSDVRGVWSAARRDQNVAALDRLLAGWRAHDHADVLSRASLHIAGFGLG